MAKFDFLPDLHHVYSKVAFFASYEQLQNQIFKNWTFRPHLVPPKGSNRGWYGIYGSSVGYHASNTSPSSKRGNILKISLGIVHVLEISHTCKKSCLWHNLQSIWNGVPLRHTHGENRYSEGMGLIGLKGFKVTSCQSWRCQEKVCHPPPAPLKPLGPYSRTSVVESFSKFDGL